MARQITKGEVSTALDSIGATNSRMEKKSMELARVSIPTFTRSIGTRQIRVNVTSMHVLDSTLHIELTAQTRTDPGAFEELPITGPIIITNPTILVPDGTFSTVAMTIPVIGPIDMIVPNLEEDLVKSLQSAVFDVVAQSTKDSRTA